jgi:hypothetical protein
MRSKSLLFILGAGASAPYGFPSGKDLVAQILHTNLPNALGELVADLHISQDELAAFQEDLRLSDLPSVDAFLENNAKYSKVGKLIIAFFLCKCETTDNLYSTNRPDNWCQYLVDTMLRNYSFPDIDKNNLAFITYNYDRSLEYYLFNALTRSYQTIAEQECIVKLAKFPILHLHGSLGAPDYYRQPNSRAYKPDLTAAQLLKASNEIHIISEKVEKYTEFGHAYNLISNADRIMFLGFGYNPANLGRLRLDDHLKPEADLWGTAYGCTNSEMLHLIEPQFKPFRTINLVAQRCRDFLRDHVDLIVG